MKRSSSPPTLLAFPVLLAGLASAQATCPNATLEIATLAPGGAQYAPGLYYVMSVSGDGRYVVFDADAAVVAGDTNGVIDVLVRDRVAGTTSLVSCDASGTIGDAISHSPAISANGRFAAFTSKASNLVAGDTNDVKDVFVKDLVTGAVERVSVNTAGAQMSLPSGGNLGERGVAISADGRFVAFESRANQLAAGTSQAYDEVFLRDRATHETRLVSFNQAYGTLSASCYHPSISADGRYVSFHSYDDLTLDANGAHDVYVFDAATNTLELGSRTSSGAGAHGASKFGELSADGRYLVFQSDAFDLPNPTPGGWTGLYRRDQVTGAVERVDVDPLGGAPLTPTSSGAGYHAVSADGRWVAFLSQSPTIVAGDTNGNVDAFVRDMTLGLTERIDLGPGGAQANGHAFAIDISADGAVAAFASGASNLLASDTNGSSDVFVRSCGAPSPPTTYCVSQVNSLGCRPAMSSSGTPSASAAAVFDVACGGELSNKAGLLFYGTSGSTLTPFFDGFLCVRTPVRRTAIQQSGGNAAFDCSGAFHCDFNARIQSGLDPTLVVAQQVWAQYWSRDPGAPTQTHLSDAITFAIAP